MVYWYFSLKTIRKKRLLQAHFILFIDAVQNSENISKLNYKFLSGFFNFVRTLIPAMTATTKLIHNINKIEQRAFNSFVELVSILSRI